MNVNGKHYRTIWLKEDDSTTIQIIDQRSLPRDFVIENLRTVEQFAAAIKEMHVRGAGLIGATAGFGMYIAMLNAPKEEVGGYLRDSAEILLATRPTAVNLRHACEHQLEAVLQVTAALKMAQTIQRVHDEQTAETVSVPICHPASVEK